MVAIHKKRDLKSEKNPVETKPETAKVEPVVVSDVVTETIEVIESINPQTAKSEVKSPPQKDPLGDFKSKMEEEMFSPDQPQAKNFMWPILFIFIIAVVLLIGIFAYKQGMFKGVKVNEIAMTPTPAITAEPTKALDLTKYEIQILNGSGIAGEASSQKANLGGEGFTIASIGNADNSDYTDTIIKAKAEVDKAFITKLKSVFEDSFTAVQTESLSEDSSVPVVVILGTKK